MRKSEKTDRSPCRRNFRISVMGRGSACPVPHGNMCLRDTLGLSEYFWPFGLACSLRLRCCSSQPVVLEMAICDGKYRIVPDTFSILLAVSALGFVGFQERWWEPIAGTVTGGFLVLIVYFFGKIIYRKEIIGGADLKFFAALGLIAGSGGIVILFSGTQLLMGVHALTLALRKRLEKNHTLPLIPYGFTALTVYFLFLWDVISFIIF